MAAKRKISQSKVIGSAIGGGAVPGMAGVQAYKYKRSKGTSKAGAGAIGGLVGAVSLLPGPGTIAGAYTGATRSIQKQKHPNQRNAKTATRTSSPQTVRAQGRVKKRNSFEIPVYKA